MAVHQRLAVGLSVNNQRRVSPANSLHDDCSSPLNSDNDDNQSYSLNSSPRSSLTSPLAGSQASVYLAAPKSPGQPDEPKPRRPSRSEHRQSLSDLGYGKIESYAKLHRLGKGTYATVYLGRSRLSNDLVALKEILKEHDEGAPCTAIREVSLLRLLRHNNIVTLHDICHTPKKLTLVFEYVGPDMYAYMKENNHLLSMQNVKVSHLEANKPLDLGRLAASRTADSQTQLNRAERFFINLLHRDSVVLEQPTCGRQPDSHRQDQAKCQLFTGSNQLACADKSYPLSTLSQAHVSQFACQLAHLYLTV